MTYKIKIKNIKWLPLLGAIVVLVYLSLLLLASMVGNFYGTKWGNWRYRLDTIPTVQSHRVVSDSIKSQVILEIVNQSKQYGVKLEDALRIADCESGFNPYAEARDTFGEGATAKGTYQFIDATWSRVGKGDVFDYKDNITAFMTYWPKHRSEWACK